MAGDHTRGVPSRAAVVGHPIHPVFVPFPLAFLVGALLTDLAYWWTADPFWGRASLWLVRGRASLPPHDRRNWA